MSIALATKFAPYTDEVFKAESKRTLLTNTDFDWTGAHTVKIWKISTASLNDYTRAPGNDDTNFSRYGAITDLNAQVEEMVLSKDRSFIFNIDKLDEDETAGQVEGGKALAREIREVVIPEVDAYTYGKMVSGAGTTAEAVEITSVNIYNLITTATATLDEAEVPETDRVLVVTPAVYSILKGVVTFDHTDVGAEMRALGVVAYMDGMAVVKVPASRLPSGFGFMVAHPSATVAPIKLEDYGLHSDTVISSGTIVTGRIAYDAFVLDNKANGIYYQPEPVDDDEDDESDGDGT